MVWQWVSLCLWPRNCAERLTSLYLTNIWYEANKLKFSIVALKIIKQLAKHSFLWNLFWPNFHQEYILLLGAAAFSSLIKSASLTQHPFVKGPKQQQRTFSSLINHLNFINLLGSHLSNLRHRNFLGQQLQTNDHLNKTQTHCARI